MYRICLINMPFAALYLPSLALTQLKSVVEERFGDRVSVEILYINHDFARFIGLDFYDMISTTLDSHSTGLGDWLFRQSAFPAEADNAETYFQRYYPHRNERAEEFRSTILGIRQRIDEFLDITIDKYGLDQADLVGFTSMFSQNVSSFALAEKIKRRNPEVVTVMGGANCESPMGQEIAKNVKQMDFIFSGTALKSFAEFLGYRLDDEPDRCHAIKGVHSRKNTLFMQTGCGGATGEELPIEVDVKLDYEPFLRTIKENFPNNEVTPVLLFETSRGCWWGEKAHCTFCGLNGQSMAYRSMSARKAVEQFDYLFKYSETCSRLESVDNILPKNYIKEVFPNLRTPSNVHIFYEVKADLSEEDMQVLSNARVKSIQPGIEALATSTLKLMRKGTDAFQNLALLKNCATYGIWPAWNLLVGFPGETEEVYKKYASDIPLLVHLPPPSGAHPVRFDRYSPYFVQARQYKLDLHPLDYYSLIYPFGKESLSNLAYYFADANFMADYFLQMVKWIDELKGKVAPWKSRWDSKDSSLQPKLHFKREGRIPTVYDSRAGEPVEHQVGETGFRLLEFLDKPRRMSQIQPAFARVPHFDAEAEISLLKEKGLIFQEGDRYLSIVLPSEPPPLESRGEA